MNSTDYKASRYVVFSVPMLPRPCYADTHSEYVILFSFPRLQWLRERPSTLRWTYIACAVQLWFKYYPVSECKRNDSRKQGKRKCCHPDKRECTKTDTTVASNAVMLVVRLLQRKVANEMSSGDVTTLT
jgi:hypothetical protein